MKKIITLIVICTITHYEIMAQATPAEQVAERIALKMKDSLALSTQQKQAIYLLNMQLHNQKMAIRQEHAQSPSLRMLLQQVENKRDSLYRPVLEDKYLLYKQKKKDLIQ